MAKKNLSNSAVQIANLVDYKSFLERAIYRIESGQSFDAWISSELMIREKIKLLHELQMAEKTHIATILREELEYVNNEIAGEKK